jgi:uncharacterized membrane protein YjjB (DUF3815 family)
MSSPTRRRAPSAPRAPWGRFPLSELVVLAAAGLAVVGVLSWGTSRSGSAFIGAMVLGCLAGLELALREHLAGHRHHGALLAATLALALATAVVLAGLPPLAAAVIGPTVFVLVAALLHRIYLARLARRTNTR